MRNFSNVELLFDQDPILVVNKPGGILTQAPPGIDSVEMRIKRDLKKFSPGKKTYLGVPHRLDRPASGVMVFATSKPATNHLARQFEYRNVSKTYWAVVQGIVEADSGTWTDYMRKIEDEARSEIVEQDADRSQLAILNFKVLKRSTKTSWLEIQLETGRTHQIRLQCSHHGHPIVGDSLYNCELEFGPTTPDMRQRWIALHARRLQFQHPSSECFHEIEAPLFEPWRQLEMVESLFN